MEPKEHEPEAPDGVEHPEIQEQMQELARLLGGLLAREWLRRPTADGGAFGNEQVHRTPLSTAAVGSRGCDVAATEGARRATGVAATSLAAAKGYPWPVVKLTCFGQRSWRALKATVTKLVPPPKRRGCRSKAKTRQPPGNTMPAACPALKGLNPTAHRSALSSRPKGGNALGTLRSPQPLRRTAERVTARPTGSACLWP